ncbi:MAG: YidC/Oxa1 family membrane protein insertase [Bacilli bacterium]
MKKLLIAVLLGLTLLTGCTKSFKDESSKKTYTANILCSPTKQETLDIYEKNKEQTHVDVSKLPKCTNYKINSGGYDGLWSTIFIKPLAWLIIKLGQLVGNYGVSIMIIGLLLRVVMIPLTNKSTKMSEGMNKAKPELDKLERKYRGREDKDSMMMKSQEMMAIYKKFDISPMSGCLFSFIQLPLFFAFLEAVNRIPVFFEENLFMFQLGTTPWEGLSAGNYWYMIIVALIILTTFFSFKNMNMGVMDPAQAKQMKFMNIFMIVFISIASFGLPTAIALYWIVSSGFTVVMNLIMSAKRNKNKLVRK